jgi:hypothetical protein
MKHEHINFSLEECAQLVLEINSWKCCVCTSQKHPW